MTLKVAIITERADISLGGAERSAFELADALRQAGLDAHLIAAIGSQKKFPADNIHILFPDKQTKRVAFFLFKKEIIIHLAANHYDIIHSFLPFDFADIYQPRGGSYPEAAIRNAESYRNTFVKNFKKITAFANLRRSALWNAEKKLSCSGTGPLIAALSNYVAAQFKKHYNTPAQRIVVIPNGVKTDGKVDSAASLQIRSQFLNRLNIKDADNPVLLLFAANNFRLKGLTILLEAFHLVTHKKTGCSFHLIVAGRGNEKKFLSIARNLGIDDRITFLHHTNNIQAVIAAADVAVLPTFYDPSSRFILESLAAGKPVITTKYNGATDLFSQNRHGRIIDRPDDANELADTILYFTDRLNIQKASSAITEDNLVKQISINCAAEQLISLYNSILERKNK
jgi:UDP-glucose:(heptosyl)LPS alpha-1,3-glucosyltransferase